MNDNWKVCTPVRRGISDSHVLRYGLAAGMILLAIVLTLTRPVLNESPFIFFLGAVTITAVWGGLGPGFLATGLSALFIRLFFVEPRFSLYHRGNLEDAERICWFVLVALVVSSLVAACRRERNLLRDSEECYRVMAETASDGIIVIDDREEILFVNPVAEKTFGAPARKLVGKTLGMLLGDEVYQSKLSEMKTHLDSRKKPVPVQVPGRKLTGGKMLLEMTFGPFSKHGKNLFTAIVREIAGPERLEPVPVS